MKRRDLVFATGALGVLAAARAFAQSPKAPRRIAMLIPTSRESSKPNLDAFGEKLKELGYIEGRDYVIEARHGDGRIELLTPLARELVALKPDVILTASSAAILALKKETTSIPIVFGTAADVVEQGMVASLARPGGNITGLTLRTETIGKVVQLVRETLPDARRIAVFEHEDAAYAARFSAAHRQPAQAAGFQLSIVKVRRPEDFERAFAEMSCARVDALIVPLMTLFVRNEKMVTDGAIKARLPLYSTWNFTRVGGLLSFTSDVPENYRRAAVMIDKIFKGAKPADIPVEEPDRFRLVINLRTAKALGITIPQSVLIRADEVIR